MGFFDDLGDVVSKKASDVANSVTDYFGDAIKDKVAGVTIGKKPGGNMTPEELARGETGYGVDLRPSSADPGTIDRAFGGVKVLGMPVVPVLIAGLVLGYFVFRRR